MNQEGNFYNPAFGEELNKILNIMLKHELAGKDKLIKQLLFIGTMRSDGKTVNHRFFRPNVK